MLYGAFKYRRSQKSKYGHEKLFADITALDHTEHRHSLAALKDTFSAVPVRYLLYYDKKWQCWFFFSYRTAVHDDTEHVRRELSEQLKVSPEALTVKWIAKRVQTKQSPDGKKTYAHTLYSAVLNDFPESLRADTFTLDGVRYRWMSLQEMRETPAIREKNLEVVDFVEEAL